MKPIHLTGLLYFMYLVSCSSSKSTGRIIKNEELGLPQYTQQNPSINISFWGDYLFHPLKAKYFDQADKRFISYSRKPFLGRRPSQLYSAHTVVAPFYSTTANYYDNLKVDTQTINNHANKLRNDFNNILKNSVVVTSQFDSIFVLNYRTINDITKVPTCYTEQFINLPKGVIRTLFWTSDCDNYIILGEIAETIKRIQIE